MAKYDWKKDGVEHLERKGCIINIQEGLSDDKGQITMIEVIENEGEKKAKYIHVRHEGVFK